MHLHSVSIENWQGIDQFHATPEGKSLILVGRNAAGKSSILRAIFCALTGKKMPDVPVKDGKTHARVNITLADGAAAQIEVQLLIVDDQTKLTITDAEGKKRTRTWLTDLVGNLMFDPYAFAAMEPRQQAKWLREIVGLDDIISSTETPLRETLRDINQRITSTEGMIERMRGAIPEGYEPGSVNLDKLQAKIDKLEPEQRAYRELEQTRWSLQQNIEHMETRRSQFVEDIATLNRQLDVAEDSLRKLEAEMKISEKDFRLAVKKLEAYQRREDLKELPALRQKLAELAGSQRYDELVKQLKDLETTHAASVKEQQVVADKLETQRRATREAIAATLPKSVTYDPDTQEVYFEGRPVTERDLNSAKLIEFGVLVNEMLNPGLQVIRIEHGSLLDAKTLKGIVTYADTHGYQLLIERVGDTDQVMVEYIERTPLSPTKSRKKK